MEREQKHQENRVSRGDCLDFIVEYLVDHGVNREMLFDLYDVLKAAKLLQEYVRQHYDALSRQTPGTGWLILEVVQPEVLDAICDRCRAGANDLGELGDDWMGVAGRFIGCWNQLDRLFGTIADHFGEDDFTEDEGVWMFDANESGGCIPEDIWHSVWDTLGMMSTTFVVTIDGKSVDIGEGMYIAYRNDLFDGVGQGMARNVAMFFAGMENEALKHSIDPNGYVCHAYRQTGMHDMFWTTGTKED